jgi:hypothetical protein
MVLVGVCTSTMASLELEGPPPGAGLVTVMYPAVGLATSEARIFACSSRVETKVVERGLRFQFTTAPETKFAPYTVSTKST